MIPGIKALTFDTFGTVVDWRTSIINDLSAYGRKHKLDTDWAAFVDEWKTAYKPGMDKVRKGDILGALTGKAGGLSGEEIGKIEIHEKLSYVAVSQRVISEAVSCLNTGRIKGKRFRATRVGQ